MPPEGSMVQGFTARARRACIALALVPGMALAQSTPPSSAAEMGGTERVRVDGALVAPPIIVTGRLGEHPEYARRIGRAVAARVGKDFHAWTSTIGGIFTALDRHIDARSLDLLARAASAGWVSGPGGLGDPGRRRGPALGAARTRCGLQRGAG